MVNATPSASTDPGVLEVSAVDGVLLLTLDGKASFEALREAVRDTFSATPDRFRGKDARLDFGTRAIDLFDLRRLVHVLKDEFGVSVTGLYCSQESLVRYTERELKLRVWARMPEVEEELVEDTLESTIEAPLTEAMVELEDDEPSSTQASIPLVRCPLVIERGLRGGQTVRHGGDVLVYGDVNPGAEIISEGNVLIFGRCEGLVHAGSEGDEGVHILAFDLRPKQLRIAARIAFPDGATPRRGPRPTYLPEVAWIDDGCIVMEPYLGRLPTTS
ncbi:MAG TPA: septum site-determining protein MinC [Myxococcota bacterium]|nr:septum site-determining protein MinC [Myxococcota bacterium]